MTAREAERLVSPQYLAGCIDCDGCINIVRMKARAGSSLRHELRIQLTNTNYEVLRKIQADYGGYLCLSMNPSKAHWKKPGVWKTQGLNAEKVITEILPYLIIKKAQAENGLMFRETVNLPRIHGNFRLSKEAYEAREHCYEVMRKLNKKGVEV